MHKLAMPLHVPASGKKAELPCPLLGFHAVIGGRYKLRLLYELIEGPRRYGELRRELVSGSAARPVTARVLSRELRELEARGLIDRKPYPVVPPRVEYSLTEQGRSLIPVIEAVARWGVEQASKRIG